MKKIVIAYATRAGSTAETALLIGERFESAGFRVETRDLRQGIDPSLYDGFVIGSAIRAGRWLSEAVRFVASHKERLQEGPTALFLTSLYLKDPTLENREKVLSFIKAQADSVRPLSVGLFPGVMDPSRLGFFAGLIAKAIKAPEGDFRKKEEITLWADQTAERFKEILLP